MSDLVTQSRLRTGHGPIEWIFSGSRDVFKAVQGISDVDVIFDAKVRYVRYVYVTFAASGCDDWLSNEIIRLVVGPFVFHSIVLYNIWAVVCVV